MAFVRFSADRVEWSTQPDIFASSNLVKRGFCSKCGTPLSYRQTSGPNISLTLNSLDDPEAVRPEMKFSAIMEVSWCCLLADLPGKEMDVTNAPGFVNYQHEIGR
jgi:hypothetical protein